MKKIMKERRPSIVILFESRISRATEDGVCKKLGKKRWTHSEARRFFRGVWVLWNDEEISLKLIYDANCFLT